MPSDVWVVDDDPSIRWVLEKALTREKIPNRLFATGAAILSALMQEKPQVIISDIRLEDMSGLDLLQSIKQRYPNVPVIIMTAFTDLETTVAAFQRGGFDYLVKPFDLDNAIALVKRALQHAQGPLEKNAVASTTGMIGQSIKMQELFRVIGRLSQSTVTVLITGESGTGKELVARALHLHSPRAKGPFIALNTAAIPKDLLESELFGHERGAFTGAQTQRRGRFEQAESGSLFLDEIGDMAPELQTRLLRVLSDGHYYRVGGHELIAANVRIIAATHQNLEQRVTEGLFREDLFHRLNVIRLRLPSLRERVEDIPILTQYLLEKSAKELGVEPKQISPEAQAIINQFPFPGNVRQLENLCHWLSVMAPSQVIMPHDLPPEIRAGQALTKPLPQEVATKTLGLTKQLDKNIPDSMHWSESLKHTVRRELTIHPGQVMNLLLHEFETTVFNTALEFTQGKRAEASELLGIGRNTLTRKLKHEITTPNNNPQDTPSDSIK